MSTLYVDTINEKTTGNGIIIPGHVLQIQSYENTITSSTITTTNFTDVNSRNFTPKSASSSLLVWVTFRWQENTNTTNAKVRILHDGDTVLEILNYLTYSGSTNIINSNTFQAYVASTGSTSARTIVFQAALSSAGGTLSINPNSGTAGSQASRMTIMEIGG
jgi:hypothetical protein